MHLSSPLVLLIFNFPFLCSCSKSCKWITCETRSSLKLQPEAPGCWQEHTSGKRTSNTEHSVLVYVTIPPYALRPGQRRICHQVWQALTSVWYWLRFRGKHASWQEKYYHYDALDSPVSTLHERGQMARQSSYGMWPYLTLRSWNEAKWHNNVAETKMTNPSKRTNLSDLDWLRWHNISFSSNWQPHTWTTATITFHSRWALYTITTITVLFRHNVLYMWKTFALQVHKSRK